MTQSLDPILAISEYDARSGGDSLGGEKSPDEKRTSTGYRDLDEALDGGLSSGHGGIVGIAADASGAEGKQLTYAILANHLISNASSCAAIIDTSGSFNVLGLFEMILTKLRRPRSTGPESVVDIADDAQVRAEKVLERVKILRAFDLLGVRESIAEIQEELRNTTQMTTEADDIHNEAIGRDVLTCVRQAKEIPDSQAEDGDDDMLLDPTPRTVLSSRTEGPAVLPKTTTPVIDIIAIDNLTQVINPLMKGNHVQAQAVLCSFLRSLSHLVATHNLLALLLISTVTPYHHATSVALPRKTTSTDNDHDLQRGHPMVSIFASNTAYPALGQTFPHFVDVMLLISRLPLNQRDARLFYTDDLRRLAIGAVKDVKLGTVVEVVRDRYRGRQGRWAIINGG